MLLRDAGFDVQLLGRTEERPNLVARLRGAADGPVLCLLSHVDTVLASPEDWQRDPWSGDLAEDFVWGRGAQDMKSQTAAEVAGAISLAQDGWRPARGDLLVVAVVDEESGGSEGAVWLTENHPDYAISLNNLALLYESMGEYARAESLFRQALEISKKTLGEAHPDYAHSLNNLALLY